MKKIGLVLLLVVVGLGVSMLGLQVRQKTETLPPQDAIERLQRDIADGKARLKFEGDHGFLQSLLDYFGIPVSSQTLVFSRSSFQIHLISPERPRAMYFNDDVYVSFVQGADEIELIAMDPERGPSFYMLEQKPLDRPAFRRETSNCLVCHDFFQSEKPLPRLLMLSVVPDPIGTAIGQHSIITNDQSPFRERWGGWWVTGTHGEERHLGNHMVRMAPGTRMNVSEYAAKADLSAGANLTDLRDRIESGFFLTPHSDIVALMVLGHQTHAQNLVVRANDAVRKAIESKSLVAANRGEPAEGERRVLAQSLDPVVKVLLFSGEVPLKSPMRGTTSFVDEFEKRGPFDPKGRSLRQFDLKTRLFRYPLSYVTYSASFDALPPVARAYVYRRFREIFAGGGGADFAHLSPDDRAALSEILSATKPDFSADK